MHFISYISANCTNCLVRQVVLCCGTQVVTPSHSIADIHHQNYGLYNRLMELANSAYLYIIISVLIALHSDGVWNKHCNTAFKSKYCQIFEVSTHLCIHPKNCGI